MLRINIKVIVTLILVILCCGIRIKVQEIDRDKFVTLAEIALYNVTPMIANTIRKMAALWLGHQHLWLAKSVRYYERRIQTLLHRACSSCSLFYYSLEKAKRIRGGRENGALQLSMNPSLI